MANDAHAMKVYKTNASHQEPAHLVDVFAGRAPRAPKDNRDGKKFTEVLRERLQDRKP